MLCGLVGDNGRQRKEERRYGWWRWVLWERRGEGGPAGGGGFCKCDTKTKEIDRVGVGGGVSVG